MQINFKYQNIDFSLSFNKNLIIFGSNKSGKTSLLKLLKDGLNGNNKNFSLNSLECKKEEYHIIYFDEETDFNNEFKFTKNNIFKTSLYDAIYKNIDKEKILSEINNSLDNIDKAVNKYLDNNINNNFKNKLTFNIDIDDIDKIIDKFTTIYVNDLIDTKEISKSDKRKLIYQLLLFNTPKDKKTFIIIDDFDLYLDNEGIVEILNLITILNKGNCHFIISTNNSNIYNYLDLNNFSIYKTKDYKLINFNNIDDILKKYILFEQYQNYDSKMEYLEFIQDNYHLITNNDLNRIKNTLYNFQKNNIGIILVSNKVYFTSLYNNILNNYIFYKDKFELELLKLVCEKLLTDYEITDII